MIGAGIMHFARPAFFVAIVPDYLPAPAALVAISGAFEIFGGLGLLWTPTRRWAAAGIVLLLIFVFPANLNMALHAERFAFPPVLLWLRLPLQPLLIFWAWFAGSFDTNRRNRLMNS